VLVEVIVAVNRGGVEIEVNRGGGVKVKMNGGGEGVVHLRGVERRWRRDQGGGQ